MDQNKLQENIGLYYSKLPKDLQDVFSDITWIEKLRNLSTKYNLTDQQVATLGSETTLLILCLINMEEYKKVLGEEISISKESFSQMIEEVETSLFKDIAPKLEETYKKNLAEISVENENVLNLDPVFLKLPKELQIAIANSNYQENLYKIATKNNLQIDKMDELEKTTIKLITGEVSPDQYESEIITRAGIPSEKAREIAKDVNENIFKRIRESMQNQEIKNNDSIIPLPPYNKEDIATKIEDANHPIYKDAGIEIMHEEADKDKISNSISDMSSFKSEMNIMKEKLDGITVSKSRVSDYSLPKINNNRDPKQITTPSTPVSTIGIENKDKYHEPIE